MVFNKFENELLGNITDKINKKQYRELLSLISSLSPIDPNNEEFMIFASEFLEIKPHDLLIMISLLETFGIVLRRGISLRITPDVLSDHILHNTCITNQGQDTGYAKKYFTAFWDTMPQNLLLNLSELDWRIIQEKRNK